MRTRCVPHTQEPRPTQNQTNPTPDSLPIQSFSILLSACERTVGDREGHGELLSRRVRVPARQRRRAARDLFGGGCRFVLVGWTGVEVRREPSLVVVVRACVWLSIEHATGPVGRLDRPGSTVSSIHINNPQSTTHRHGLPLALHDGLAHDLLALLFVSMTGGWVGDWVDDQRRYDANQMTSPVPPPQPTGSLTDSTDLQRHGAALVINEQLGVGCHLAHPGEGEQRAEREEAAGHWWLAWLIPVCVFCWCGWMGERGWRLGMLLRWRRDRSIHPSIDPPQAVLSNKNRALSPACGIKCASSPRGTAQQARALSSGVGRGWVGDDRMRWRWPSTNAHAHNIIRRRRRGGII